MGVTIALLGNLVGSSAFGVNIDQGRSALEMLSVEHGSPMKEVLSDRIPLEIRGFVTEKIQMKSGATTVLLPADPKDESEILNDQTHFKLTIGLPFADESKEGFGYGDGVMYDHKNGSKTYPLVKVDGSVQLATVISSPDAPTRFEYILGLPKGSNLKILAGGEVAILGRSGEFLGGFTAPWAVDSNGDSVPTRFEVVGSTLIQFVSHSSEFAYPIVADPWAGQALLYWAEVSFYSNYYSVDAKATAWGRVWSGLATHAAHVSELKAKLGVNSWRVDTNNGTIREQFLCHVVGNLFSPGLYNMESFRPSMHWATQLNLVHQCNP